MVELQVPAEVNRNSFYFVTSEALYQHVNGTYHYTELVQNWDGAVLENTVTPPAPVLNTLSVDGQSNLVTVEWLNNQQLDFETYSIWRNFGDPFGLGEDNTDDISPENGWELHESGIYDSGASWNSFSFSRTYDVPSNVDRDVWYAVTVSDTYGNSNMEAFPGSGGNALKVTEDTTVPTATYQLFDGQNNLYTSPSLVSGSYEMRLLANEYLFSLPQIEITTDTGGIISGGVKQMLLYADNLGNPNLGPEYYLTFDIDNSVSAGTIIMNLSFTDESLNFNNIVWDNLSLDAKRPTLQVYSPASGTDGSKYLYGNSIQLLAGASDDVQISSFQYRFIYNYGSGAASTSPWTNPQNLQDINGDYSSLVIDDNINSGNFESGQHSVTFRAIDTAGNEISSQVVFVVDNCRNRLDGTTVCNYVESLKPDPEPVVVNPSFSDPPYIMVWVLSGVVLFSIITMLVVIQTSMRGPKKSSDDDIDDDDWMSEFIGTSQDVDMDAITQTVQKDVPQLEEEEEEEDPFAVNIPSRKSRRRKAPEVVEEEEDDDEAFFGIDDDDDDDFEDEPPKKRKVGRRLAPKDAPKRRQVGRRKKTGD